MLAPERHALILQHLQSHGSASLATLMELTGASGSTLRRDLRELSTRDGALRRTHGGVVSNLLDTATYEPPSQVAQHLHAEEKRAIGRAAAELIDEGQSVVFDSGSTVVEAARAVVGRGLGIIAITNDLTVAQILNGSARVRLIVTGGTVRHGSNTLHGFPGHVLLQEIQADVMLLGAHAISDEGLSESSIEIAEMKRRMMAAARRVILLADASKFGRRAFARICGLHEIHTLVSDKQPPEFILESMRESGAQFVMADQELFS